MSYCKKKKRKIGKKYMLEKNRNPKIQPLKFIRLEEFINNEKESAKLKTYSRNRKEIIRNKKFPCLF